MDGEKAAPRAPIVPRGVEPRRAWQLGLLVSFLYLLVALPLLRSYGATWDTVLMDYPYGERMLEYVLTGEDAYLSLRDKSPAPPVRAPHPDFSLGHSPWYQAYPVGALLSAVSCRLLWTRLGLVPAMQAHNLVIPLLVACLLIVLVRFAAVRFGALGGIAAGLFLIASPRFFANAEVNLRDVPVACAYATATLLGYRALTGGSLRWWIGTGVMTGIALGAKANALFIPPQFLLFLLLAASVPGLRSRASLRWSWPGFALGTLAVLGTNFLVSPHYWSMPISGPLTRLSEIMRLGSSHFDEGVTSTTSTMTHYAPWLILTTTPIVILVLAGLGLVSNKLSRPLRAFLFAALVVTVGRNMLPGVRNHGGIRRFLEFYPYVCIAAGAGLAALHGAIVLRARGTAMRYAAHSIAAACLLFPSIQSLRTNPNGIAYFNVLAGGLEGAQRSGIPNATDYWANSYWQAFGWLNEHAEADSQILVPIAAHVAASIAPVRLRKDLSLLNSAVGPEHGIVYALFITRRRAYHAFERALEQRMEPAHDIRLQGGVLTRIYRLDRDEDSEELLSLWNESIGVRPNIQRIRSWLEAHPREGVEAWNIARNVDALGVEEACRRLRELLPGELHEGLEGVLGALSDHPGPPRAGKGSTPAAPLR